MEIKIGDQVLLHDYDYLLLTIPSVMEKHGIMVIAGCKGIDFNLSPENPLLENIKWIIGDVYREVTRSNKYTLTVHNISSEKGYTFLYLKINPNAGAASFIDAPIGAIKKVIKK